MRQRSVLDALRGGSGRFTFRVAVATATGEKLLAAPNKGVWILEQLGALLKWSLAEATPHDSETQLSEEGAARRERVEAKATLLGVHEEQFEICEVDIVVHARKYWSIGEEREELFGNGGPAESAAIEPCRRSRRRIRLFRFSLSAGSERSHVALAIQTPAQRGIAQTSNVAVTLTVGPATYSELSACCFTSATVASIIPTRWVHGPMP